MQLRGRVVEGRVQAHRGDVVDGVRVANRLLLQLEARVGVAVLQEHTIVDCVLLSGVQRLHLVDVQAAVEKTRLRVHTVVVGRLQ